MYRCGVARANEIILFHLEGHVSYFPSYLRYTGVYKHVSHTVLSFQTPFLHQEFQPPTTTERKKYTSHSIPILQKPFIKELPYNSRPLSLLDDDAISMSNGSLPSCGGERNPCTIQNPVSWIPGGLVACMEDGGGLCLEYYRSDVMKQYFKCML